MSNPEQPNQPPKQDEQQTAATPASGLTLKPATRKSVRINPSELAKLSSSSRRKKSGGGFFGFIFLFLIGAIISVAVLYYQGKINVPPAVAEILDGVRDALPEKIIPVKTASADKPVSPAPEEQTTAATTDESTGFSSNQDFIAGAKKFNQALADYKNYQQTRENPAILARVEENARAAIAHFEACRDQAPPHIDIAGYIDQCNGLIFDVHQSTTLDMTTEGGATKPGSGAAPAPTNGEPPPSPKVQISFLDEPPPPARRILPASILNATENKPEEAPAEEPARLLMSFDPAWQQTRLDGSGAGDEIKNLLRRHAEPSEKMGLDGSVYLYRDVRLMMSANEAAELLDVKLPVRRSVVTPGLPANSLFYYTLAGEFGWANTMTLVVDRNDRVVMSQLVDDRPAAASLEPALYSPNWGVIDFITLQRRAEGDGLIAHRVRQRDGLIRIESELATTGNDRNVKTRVSLTMPRELAGLILKTGQ